jgi:hypothetical protein
LQVPVTAGDIKFHTVRPVAATGTFHVYDPVGVSEGVTDPDLLDALLLSEFKKDFGHGATVLAWNGRDVRGDPVATGGVCV